MGRLAGEGQVQAAGGAVDGAFRQTDGAEGQARHVVEREGIIGGDLREVRVGDDLGRAGAGFLGGLEEQNRAAFRRPLAGEAAGEAGDDGHVPVMPAKVALAVGFRAVVRRSGLVDRQRVKLAAEEHGGPRFGTLIDHRDAVAAEPGDQVIRPKGRQGEQDTLGRARLFA